MKFLHTSDWQIGMKAAATGGAAAAVRAARLEAAARVVAISADFDDRISMGKGELLIEQIETVPRQHSIDTLAA